MAGHRLWRRPAFRGGSISSNSCLLGVKVPFPRSPHRSSFSVCLPHVLPCTRSLPILGEGPKHRECWKLSLSSSNHLASSLQGFAAKGRESGRQTVTARDTCSSTPQPGTQEPLPDLQNGGPTWGVHFAIYLFTPEYYRVSLQCLSD